MLYKLSKKVSRKNLFKFIKLSFNKIENKKYFHSYDFKKDSKIAKFTKENILFILKTKYTNSHHKKFINLHSPQSDLDDLAN